MSVFILGGLCASAFWLIVGTAMTMRDIRVLNELEHRLDKIEKEAKRA
jgi:hypothetical protein